MQKAIQLEFKKVKGWGGKRKGAGRKNRSKTVSHGAREAVDFKKPLHITKRLKPGLRGLRCKPLKLEFEKSLKKAKQKGVHFIHYSLEDNHLHLFVEAADKKALSSGMNSLGTRFAKAVRKKIGGSGSVFEGRYHLKVLKSPRQVKNALAYVLLNHSKHQKLIPYSDDFSSAAHFHEWRRLLGNEMGPILKNQRECRLALPDHLSEARSWLARAGWKKAF